MMLHETQDQREEQLDRLEVGQPHLVAAIRTLWNAMESGYQRCADMESCRMFVRYAKEVEYHLDRAIESLPDQPPQPVVDPTP
jgi:hypothetical protein